MSVIGISISDITDFIKLAAKTYEGWHKAHKVYNAIARDLSNLLNLLELLVKEAALPRSLLHARHNEGRTGDVWEPQRAWKDLYAGCEDVVRDLNALLRKYSAINSGRNLNVHWKRIKLGTTNLSDLHDTLDRRTLELSAFVTVLGLGSHSRVENEVLPRILRAISDLAARVRAGNETNGGASIASVRSRGGASVAAWTTHSEDDLGFYREMRSELHAMGFRKTELRKYKAAWLVHLMKLREEGAFEEEEPVANANPLWLKDSEDSGVSTEPAQSIEGMDAVHTMDAEASTHVKESSEATGPEDFQGSTDIKEPGQSREPVESTETERVREDNLQENHEHNKKEVKLEAYSKRDKLFNHGYKPFLVLSDRHNYLNLQNPAPESSAAIVCPIVAVDEEEVVQESITSHEDLIETQDWPLSDEDAVDVEAMTRSSATKASAKAVFKEWSEELPDEGDKDAQAPSSSKLEDKGNRGGVVESSGKGKVPLYHFSSSEKVVHEDLPPTHMKASFKTLKQSTKNDKKKETLPYRGGKTLFCSNKDATKNLNTFGKPVKPTFSDIEIAKMHFDYECMRKLKAKLSSDSDYPEELRQSNFRHLIVMCLSYRDLVRRLCQDYRIANLVERPISLQIQREFCVSHLLQESKSCFDSGDLRKTLGYLETFVEVIDANAENLKHWQNVRTYALIHLFRCFIHLPSTEGSIDKYVGLAAGLDKHPLMRGLLKFRSWLREHKAGHGKQYFGKLQEAAELVLNSEQLHTYPGNISWMEIAYAYLATGCYVELTKLLWRMKNHPLAHVMIIYLCGASNTLDALDIVGKQIVVTRAVASSLKWVLQEQNMNRFSYLGLDLADP